MRHSRLLLGLAAAALWGSAGPSEVSDTSVADSSDGQICSGSASVSVPVQWCAVYNGTPPIPEPPYIFPGDTQFACENNSTLLSTLQFNDVISLYFTVVNEAFFQSCSFDDSGSCPEYPDCCENVPVTAKFGEGSHLDVKLDCLPDDADCDTPMGQIWQMLDFVSPEGEGQEP